MGRSGLSISMAAVSLCGALAISIGAVARDDAGQSREHYSPAETLLWLSDHLANIRKPTKLRYEFRKSGTLEAGFTDTVELDIMELHPDGMRSARVNFLTGERHQPVPLGDHIRGNPVLGAYLQGDVYEMKRLTDGGWPYFQRRIKFALADGAGVEPVTLDHGGRKIEAKTITITPYAKDPRRAVFEKFAEKRYEFTLSDHIPGTLYQIHTVVPGKAKSTDPPLIEETLTFVEFKDL